ncbi:MAG: S8 family serine peptidase [Bacteroidetes bacterium]|nr:S8 family serine peptidase [Bacteroidota bacterium]MDA0902790.1 S8 family serine peptidase [Bacteroidota bacterium]MDA1243062.1 S8 family serine peptidase [Bacteroidota bacterium]
MRFFASQTFLFVLWLCATLACAQVMVDDQLAGPEALKGEWIVQLEPGQDCTLWQREAQRLLDSSMGEKAHWTPLSLLAGIWLVQLDASPVRLAEVEEALVGLWSASLGVEIFQKNHVVSSREVPSDPQFGQQWHHLQPQDHDMDSELAWAHTTGGWTASGDPIVVAVLEGGGAAYNHPDLLDNHWVNSLEIPNNGLDDDLNGFVDDVHGWNASTASDAISPGSHGTAVCGMIGARGNNGVGGAGINWNVDVMVVQMGSLTESNVIAAYDYPYTMRHLYNQTNGEKGALVVATNASWGIDNADPSDFPVWCSFYNDMGAAGMLSIAATSNNDINVEMFGDMPTGCGSPFLISVTATDDMDQRGGTGFGPNTIDLGAPGIDVLLPTASGGSGWVSGTSYASPAVAGTVALLYSVSCDGLVSELQATPALAALRVKNWILNSVDAVPDLQGITVTGGRLNVGQAVLNAMDACGCLNPLACNYNNEAVLPSGMCLFDDVCGECGGDGTGCLGCINPEACNFDALATLDDGSCEYETCLGCTDPAACNFDDNAIVDDGSCVVGFGGALSVGAGAWGEAVGWALLSAEGDPTVAGIGATDMPLCVVAGCYQFMMTDVDGDGWNGASYALLDEMGEVVASGSLDDASFGDGMSVGWDVMGLGQVTCQWGCTDEGACNYNMLAVHDDGNCMEPHPVFGCPNCEVTVSMDPLWLAQGEASPAVEISAAGLLDSVWISLQMTSEESLFYASDVRVELVLPNGSCVYWGGDNSVPSACTSVGNAGSVWPIDWGAPNSGAYFASLDLSWLGLSGEGLWSLRLVNAYPSWAPSLTEPVGLGASFGLLGLCEGIPHVEGCTDPAACNFVEQATADNGTCEFELPFAFVDADGDGFGSAPVEGICPPLASGFSLASGDCDDGSPWVYPGALGTGEGIDNNCNGQIEGLEQVNCTADLNEDGQVSVADVLEVLGAFGCISGCPAADVDGDGSVAVSDLLYVLVTFGMVC